MGDETQELKYEEIPILEYEVEECPPTALGYDTYNIYSELTGYEDWLLFRFVILVLVGLPIITFLFIGGFH